MGAWVRVKHWVRDRVHALVWPLVRSRIYQKLRALVSKAIVPVSYCGLGAAIGAAAAFAFAFPAGYGALIGVAATAGALGLMKVFRTWYPVQQRSIVSRFTGVFRSRRETSSGRMVVTQYTTSSRVRTKRAF